jgi:hypothetical protein
MSTADPAARLTAAATHLRTLLTAIAPESPADLPLHADGQEVTQGRAGLLPFATAETPQVAAYIVAMGPQVGALLVAWLDSAAFDAQMIGVDPEALAVADAILAGADQ